MYLDLNELFKFTFAHQIIHKVFGDKVNNQDLQLKMLDSENPNKFNYFNTIHNNYLNLLKTNFQKDNLDDFENKKQKIKSFLNQSISRDLYKKNKFNPNNNNLVNRNNTIGICFELTSMH